MLRLEVWENNHFLWHISIFFSVLSPFLCFYWRLLIDFFPPLKMKLPHIEISDSVNWVIRMNRNGKRIVDCFPGF